MLSSVSSSIAAGSYMERSGHLRSDTTGCCWFLLTLDHHQSDQVGKDGAKEDDDKGAVNKLIRGRCLGSVTRIDLMKQPRVDSQ